MTVPARPTASLSVRLVAGALVWLTLMLAVGGGVLAAAFRHTVEQEFGNRVDAVLRALIAVTEIADDGTVKLVRPVGDPRFDQVYSGWYWQVTEPTGKHIRSRSMWDFLIVPTAGGTELQTRRLDGPVGERLLVAERDLQFAGARGPVHLLVAADLQEVANGARRFDLLLAVALGLLGLGLAVAILIQVRFGLRPLRAMAADLDAVRLGDRARLSGGYPREVAPLAEAMNAVLDQDETLIERARTHVGNLAHGLKTPLAVIAAEMDGTPDKRVVGGQVQAMRRLIEHHLGRAVAVAGAGRVQGVKVSIDDVVREVAAVLARICSERGVRIETEMSHAAVFRGHREDLAEIVGNLMENACKWAGSRVLIRAEDRGEGLILSFEDDGPGMSADQAREAARRGTRLDEQAPGWGLGLSIVADIVEVNGGRMELARSALGGLAVTITLPQR